MSKIIASNQYFYFRVLNLSMIKVIGRNIHCQNNLMAFVHCKGQTEGLVLTPKVDL